ncbi:MAG: hypothetical protein IT500_16785, partial [Rubrivivax sp.]|nr:hypothetical protein [Rubrivivax sp.]
MFDTLLIANRGEIACRIIRSCRRLGLRSVAVYSEADAHARHVREADAALCIGPAAAARSYLDAEAIVRAAQASGAQAVHPGYGFLSERLALVQACQQAGLVFVGPHARAIETMGSKIESKRIARAAGVPCVAGYDGDDQGLPRLLEEAQRIGLPLLIKASAGGGGKGMRRVDRLQDRPAQLASAQAEAQAAFGDARVMLERFIPRPRHVEVQLLGDRHGRLVHLFERECSIQRHYQKLIEETPAPHLGEGVRQRLFDAALALGRKIGYDSAGTVEFVLDAERGDEPAFLEVNARLQVEHPVTEETTGIDLVEWQIRVAAGQALPWRQDELAQRGHAIEARVNAEDPAARFAPSLGPLRGYAEPQAAGLRIDSGVDAGSEVTPHYDSLLAKVIAWGPTREAARARLRQGLQGLRVGGLRTTQPLLDEVLASPAFGQPLHTGFLDAHWPEGWQPAPALRRQARALAALAWLQAQQPEGDERPLASLRGWRVDGVGVGRCHLVVEDDDAAHELSVQLGLRTAGVEDAEGVLQARCAEDGRWALEAAAPAASPQPATPPSAQLQVQVQVQGARVEVWQQGWSTTL